MGMEREMKDIRVIVTVKNAVMLRAMEQAGFTTATELARASGVNNSTVGDYLNLKRAPYNPSGELRDSIVRIGYALKRLPEDLFPAPFLRRALQTNRVTRDVEAASLPALMHQAPPSIAYDPERSLIVKEAVDSLIAALDTIKTGDGQSDARNIAVLKHYYGLEGGEASTLEATAKHFGVTRERVRQILLRVERRLKRKLNSPQYQDAKSAMLEMMAP
jgi:transcriptional regulator with XRE-family HTH domain